MTININIDGRISVGYPTDIHGYSWIFGIRIFGYQNSEQIEYSDIKIL